MNKLNYTILTTATNQVKTLFLEDGKLTKSSVANPATGYFLAYQAGTLTDFASALNSMTAKQSLIVGAVVVNNTPLAVGKKVGLCLKGHESDKAVSRSKEFIKNISQPGFFLFDIDGNSAGLDEIKAFIPELSGIGAVVKPSSSSMIYDKEGNQLVGAKGLHIYVPILDMSDADRVAAVFWGRMWLAGHGHYLISQGVHPMLLERGLFDATVLGKSERLAFEAKPILKDGLTQRDNVAVVVDGDVLDTSLVQNLTATQLTEIAQLKQAAKELVRPAHEKAIKVKKAEYIASGHNESDYDGLRNHVLPRDFMLQTSQGLIKAGDLDGSHNNVTMRDPYEPDYDGGSFTKAKFYWNDGKPVINSQAHGGVKYTIKAASKPPFAEWLVSQKLDNPESLYSFFFSHIKETAAAVGIDLAVDDLNVSRSGKNNRVLPLVAGDDSKLAAFVKLQEHHGVMFPEFSFSTTKGYGSDIKFSTHSAAWAVYNAGVLPVGKLTVGKATVKKALKETTVDIEETAAQKQERVNGMAALYETASDNLDGSYYLKRAFQTFTPARPLFNPKATCKRWINEKTRDFYHVAIHALKKAGVRFGVDDKGGYLLVRLQNRSDRVVGFQKIYDLDGVETAYIDKGHCGAFFALGADKAKFDDYVFVSPDLLSGVAVYMATGKPVFVAGTSENLIDVLKAVKGFGYKRAVVVAANDALGNGANAGVYWALKASKAHTARVFVPQRATFHDVLMMDGVLAVNKQLAFKKNKAEIVPALNVFDGAIQLLAVCPDDLVYKTTWICACSAVSNQIEMDLNQAFYEITRVLVQRGVAIKKAKKDARRTLESALDKATERCKLKNTASFDGFNAVIDATRPAAFGYGFVKQVFLAAGVKYSVFKNMVQAHGLFNVHLATQILAKKGIWLDNRPMGTGKTELMGAVLALSEARNYSCSYICHRQSLVANSSDRINATSYKRLNSQAQTNHEMSISVCVNSIINSFYHEFVTAFSNVLFIDEIRQTLEHIATGTVKSFDRKRVYEALVKSIDNADYVLGSDADLNQATVNWLKKNFPEKDFFGLRCAVAKPTAGIEYGHYDVVWNLAMDSVKAGTPTLIQLDSSNAAMAMYQAVKHPERKVLVITGDNKAGEDAEDSRAKKFLLNPNEEISKYDCVIHSPVIGTGVSITCDHIKAHFALFRGILAENEVLQMIGRNRTSKKIMVGFNDKHTKNRVNSAENLRDGEVLARQRVQDGAIITDDLDLFRISVVAARNDSLNDFAVQSLLLMRAKGYQIKRCEGDLDKDAQVMARQQAKDVHCVGVVSNNENRINHHDAERLERAESLTQEESYQLEHFKIIEDFALSSAGDGVSLPMVTDDDVKLYDGGRVMKIIRNREIAEASRAQRKQVDIDYAGFKATAKGHFIDNVLIECRRGDIDQEWAYGICEWLTDNHKELGALGLGNYERQSKYVFRTLNNFLANFGYKLGSKQIGSGDRRGCRVYRLVSDERIDAIVDRRDGTVNAFKNVVTDEALIN